MRASADTALFSLHVDLAYTDSNGMTPLVQCAKSGQIEVFSLMLVRANPMSHGGEKVHCEAAGNGECGAALPKVLFDLTGDQVTITKGIVKAAEGNEESGAAVMRLLLDQGGEQVHVTEHGVVVRSHHDYI